MDQLRRVLSTIQQQLGVLTPAHKMLIGALSVIGIMTLFLVSLWANKPDRVILFSGESPEYQVRAVSHLERHGIDAKTDASGGVTVPAESRYAALGLLGSAQLLPEDANQLLFSNLKENQSWTNTQRQNDDLMSIAKMNELARVMANFPSIDRANVFISQPARSGGIGRSFISPTAQVTVFPASGNAMNQGTVDALAAMVSGSVAGLSVTDVKVIDGLTGQWHRSRSPDDMIVTTYAEAAAAEELRVRDKILTALSHVPNVIVAVNAMVDASIRESSETNYKNTGEGTVSVPSRERSDLTEQQDKSSAGEPGLRSNMSEDIVRSGSGGNSLTKETSEGEFETRFGERIDRERAAVGKPTQINVAVNIPRDWVARFVPFEEGQEVAPADIEAYWADNLRSQIEGIVKPLVQTSGIDGTVRDGMVQVTMMPVAMASAVPGASGGAAGVAGTFASGRMIDRFVMGALAMIAIVAMVLMVRKAGKTVELPTAAEIVGIPPAIQKDDDVVGEADEGDAAMMGIEIDDEQMGAKRMLEEITELVAKEPDEAAAVMNRWVRTND